MATIRIQFPEKAEATALKLDAPRITIGRLPSNTIQIIDRTMSAYHAELLLEDGHYRLHDLGSTNGVMVNGQPVTDYHLHEECRISFGAVECDYVANDAPGDQPAAEALPSRAELEKLASQNTAFQATIAALREEVEALKQANADGSDETVRRAEFDRVVEERAALKEAEIQRQQEFAQLQRDLVVLRRDRQNVQKALDAAQSELEALTKSAAPDLRKPQAGQAADQKIEETSAAPGPVPQASPAATAWSSAPAKPAAPAVPAAPAMPAPAPKSAPAMPAPTPKSAPAMPAAAPSAPGLPKPPDRMAPAPAGATSKGNVPATARPTSPGVPVAKPRMLAAQNATPPGSGPKGTQRISVEAARPV
jgi:hypothetical protein